jgi:hypothetical protein
MMDKESTNEEEKKGENGKVQDGEEVKKEEDDKKSYLLYGFGRGGFGVGYFFFIKFLTGMCDAKI